MTWNVLKGMLISSICFRDYGFRITFYVDEPRAKMNASTVADMICEYFLFTLTPTDRFSSTQNNEKKSPL